MLQLQATCIEQANEGFAALGLKVGGVQLEGGSRLSGLVQANRCGAVVFMSTNFDQRVHFTGQPMAGMTPFAVMSTGDSWYHGDTSTGSDLCGFGDNVRSTTDTHFVGRMDLIYVPSDLLRFNLQQCGAKRAQQRLMVCNNVAFPSADRREYLRMHSKGLAGEISRESQVIDMLTLMLNAPVPFEPVRESAEDLASLRAFVEGCRRHAKDGPASLSDIVGWEGVYLGKTQLNKLCQQRYGLPTKDYFKRWRLEETRCALIKAEVESIDEVRRIYGFNSRNQFASDYLAVMGEKPSDTLKRGKQEAG